MIPHNHNRKVRRPRMVSIRSGQMSINRVAWWRRRIGVVAACKSDGTRR